MEATPSGYPLEGCYITIELNWSINRNRLTNATYSEGEHWGRIAAVDLAGDGGWDISFSGSFVDALGSGKFVGHGWGIYKGLHIKGTYLETSPSSESLVFSGYVTNPGGS